MDTLRSDSARRALVGLLGAAIGIVLTPFMAAVWSYEPGVVWSETTLVTRTFGPALESAGLLTFGAEGLPYEVYGKGFFLVYLLMIPVIRAVRPSSQPGGWTTRLSLRSWRVVHGAAWVAAVGDSMSYWGVSVPGAVGDSLWGFGFVVEILALLTLLVSTIVFSVSAWRGRVVPTWAGMLLLLAVLAVVPVNAYVTSYAPNSVVVPLSIAWAAIGVRLWITTTGAGFSERRG